MRRDGTNMKRDSGSNIWYINGTITALIFNINFPLYVHKTPFLHQLYFISKLF